MSQENVETIRRMYDAWLAEDYETVFGVYDPEIRLNPDPEASWVGIGDIYVGHDGVRRYMAAVYEAFDDYRPEVEDIIDVGEDRVLTLAIEHARGRISGAEVEAARTAHLWRLRDGRAVQVDLFIDRGRALEAVGLRERGRSRENVEVVRRWVESLARGDTGAHLWHEDLVIDNTADFPIRGPYRGHHGLQRWWNDIAEVVEGLRLEMDEYIDVDGERVVTRNRFIGKMRLTGLDGDTGWASILWVRDGKITRAAGYMSIDEALEAVRPAKQARGGSIL
ncbi:MAG: nuclear transport factor 2 family protein [Actinomycetota bacterium]|nr:nuclear transport factor 2 family protein [Actinomycetota bacterium]